MCLTPAAAAAPSAARPGRECDHAHRGLERRRAVVDLGEEAAQVPREVVEVAAGRHDVDEAEQRGAQLGVLGGQVHRLLVELLEGVARGGRERGGEVLADGEELGSSARASSTAVTVAWAHADRRRGRRAHRRRRRRWSRQLRARGHEPLLHGALAEGEREDWAWCSEAAARDVAEGRAEQGVVCCWTGTGASIAANKVPGVRAALCGDAVTAAGAREWNDANVLALSLRVTSEAQLGEILDAWFATGPSADPGDAANVATSPTSGDRAQRAGGGPAGAGRGGALGARAARAVGLRRSLAPPAALVAPRRARVGAGRAAAAGARRCEVLVNPANLAPVAFPRNVVVIHDAAALREPGWYSPLYARWQRTVLPLVARRALRVVTVSEFSRGELRGAARGRGGRGAGRGGCAVRCRGVPAPLSGRPYVLTVASPDRSQEPGALEVAARRLAGEGIELVAAGGDRPQFRDDASSSSVRFLRARRRCRTAGLYAGGAGVRAAVAATRASG